MLDTDSRSDCGSVCQAVCLQGEFAILRAQVSSPEPLPGLGFPGGLRVAFRGAQRLPERLRSGCTD